MNFIIYTGYNLSFIDLYFIFHNIERKGQPSTRYSSSHPSQRVKNFHTSNNSRLHYSRLSNFLIPATSRGNYARLTCRLYPIYTYTPNPRRSRRRRRRRRRCASGLRDYGIAYSCATRGYISESSRPAESSLPLYTRVPSQDLSRSRGRESGESEREIERERERERERESLVMLIIFSKSDVLMVRNVFLNQKMRFVFRITVVFDNYIFI